VPRKFESVTPENQGTYIDGADREAYTERPMKLVGIRYEPTARFGPRHVITAAMLDSGELVAIALAANPTRLAMFARVQSDLDADGAEAYEPVCLIHASRSGGNAFWTFRTATDDELAAALATPEPADDDDVPEIEVADDDVLDAGPEPEPAKRGRR
jgi:hypothetical protein